MTRLSRAEILDAAADFVDPDTGEPLPEMEDYGPEFLGHFVPTERWRATANAPYDC